MAYPPVTSLGTVPQRTQTPAEFATNADSFLGALPNFRTELNAFGAYVDAAGASIDATIGAAVAGATAASAASAAAASGSASAAATSASAAAGSATASASSATSALAYKDLAASNANFKGLWSSLTGALNVPAMVYHSGIYWNLTANLANVTTAQPGISASWIVANGDSFRQMVDGLFKRATLDLDFSANSHKVYEQFGLEPKQLQSAVVTARNSTATYQTPTSIATSAINTPRITFDATTGNALGLLCEEQRTNLLLHSQYTAASGETPPTGWTFLTSTGITTTAASTRFVGAIRATQSGAAQRECYQQNVTLAANTTYTLSAYFASGTAADGVILRAQTAAADATTGATQLSGVSFSSAGVYSITFTTGSTGGVYQVYVGLGCSGNATGTVIHETPQLEVGPAFTSYIPTTTAQVTRLADVISRALTTTNANAGAIFIEFDLTSYDKAAGLTTIVKITDSANTGNRGFALVVNNNTFDAYIRSAALTQSRALTVTDSAVPAKALVSFDNTSLKLIIAINGVSAESAMVSAVDISAFISHLFVAGASGMGGSAPYSKTVKRCTYFPRSFTAAEAQAITA